MISPDNDNDDYEGAMMIIKILHLSRLLFHNCSNLGSPSYSFSPNRQSDHNHDDNDDKDDDGDKDGDNYYLIAETHDGKGDGESQTAGE